MSFYNKPDKYQIDETSYLTPYLAGGDDDDEEE